VHVTTNGGGAWTNASAACRALGHERALRSARSRDRYVTVSGFGGMSLCPRPADTGSRLSWQPIAGNLPEAPVNDLLAHPVHAGRLFVATDVVSTRPPTAA